MEHKLDFMQYIKDRIQGKAPKGAKRSPQWRAVRDLHIKLNPQCIVCGGKTKLVAHHIIPFSIAPDLELNMENLLTLCESKKYGINCHLFMGHLGGYRRVNPTCLSDALTWQMKLAN